MNPEYRPFAKGWLQKQECTEAIARVLAHNGRGPSDHGLNDNVWGVPPQSSNYMGGQPKDSAAVAKW